MDVLCSVFGPFFPRHQDALSSRPKKWNDEEGGEMGTTGLVFGHDESEDKSDD